jgi:hypothetical protein
MNLIELQRAVTQLRLGGTASVLETRLQQAQCENMPPIDLMSCLVNDELHRPAGLFCSVSSSERSHQQTQHESNR